MRAKFDFCDVPPGLPDTAIVIKDVGHDKGCMTVTNDAEEVVATVLRLAKRLNEPDGFRIFYYDSGGRLDELCYADGRFTGFKPGPQQ